MLTLPFIILTFQKGAIHMQSAMNADSIVIRGGLLLFDLGAKIEGSSKAGYHYNRTHQTH